jgi:hypothetical protein
MSYSDVFEILNAGKEGKAEIARFWSFGKAENSPAFLRVRGLIVEANEKDILMKGPLQRMILRLFPFKVSFPLKVPSLANRTRATFDSNTSPAHYWI